MRASVVPASQQIESTGRAESWRAFYEVSNEVRVSYVDFYRNLDGLTALATAAATPLRRQKEEKNTAFVKRIVATYLSLAHKAGVHQ